MRSGESLDDTLDFQLLTYRDESLRASTITPFLSFYDYSIRPIAELPLTWFEASSDDQSLLRYI